MSDAALVIGLGMLFLSNYKYKSGVKAVDVPSGVTITIPPIIPDIPETPDGAGPDEGTGGGGGGVRDDTPDTSDVDNGFIPIPDPDPYLDPGEIDPVTSPFIDDFPVTMMDPNLAPFDDQLDPYIPQTLPFDPTSSYLHDPPLSSFGTTGIVKAFVDLGRGFVGLFEFGDPKNIWDTAPVEEEPLI